MNTKYSTLGFDKIYVINLKRRLDRKKSLIDSFPTVDFTFIEAVDGKDLNQEQLLEDKILNSSFFDPNGMVTMGVFACALSHKKAWDQALSDGVENALFLEDDVILHKQVLNKNNIFTDEYSKIINEIENSDYDLIHLGKKKEYNDGLNVGKYLTIPTPGSNWEGAHSYAATNNMLQVLTNKVLPIKNAADVYLEQFYNTHNSFTIKNSIFLQISDLSDSSVSDSDTFFNEFRKGGGRVGISFDENGNILNKNIAKYIKHPKEVDDYTEIVLSEPKFGIQKFTSKGDINVNFFSITKLLIFLLENLDKGGKMVEINSHLGENTFYFGSSGLFSNIYAVDPLKGEDEFNLKHNLSWEDVEIGFNNNNYFHKNINHIKLPPVEAITYLPLLLFLYINNRKKENISDIIKLYLSKIEDGCFIVGDNIHDAPPNSIIYGNNWLIEKKNITYL